MKNSKFFTMGHQSHRHRLGMYALFTLAVLITACSSDEILGDNNPMKMFTKDELGDKIKDLLEHRPERPDGPDFDMDFETLFGELDSLATGMPDDFEFDINMHGPPETHPLHRNAKAMECLRDANQFSSFMRRVHEVLQELRDEYHDDLLDSMDVDDGLDSQDNDTSTSTDHDMDSSDQDTSTDTPDSQQDSSDDSPTTDSPDIDLDDGFRKKRDMELEGFDLDEVFDRFSDDDIECLGGFISKGDEKFLCLRYARRSSVIFTKILAAGADCDDYLLGSDEDDDDDDDVSDDVGDFVEDIVEEITDDLTDDGLEDSKMEDVVEEIVEEMLDNSKDDSTSDVLEEITDLLTDDKDVSDSLEDDKAHNITDDVDDKLDDLLDDTSSLDLTRDDDESGPDDSVDDDLDDIMDDLTEDLDDRDDGSKLMKKLFRLTKLDESHQLAILNRFKEKESVEWTDDDVKKVLALAPDVIDDDFLEDLPEELFKQNMRHLGKLAALAGGNPRLRYALRERLDDLDFSTITSDDLREIGPGLLSLRLDQIEGLNGQLLLDVDLDDLFDDRSRGQDSADQDDMDDDDDDDDDDDYDDVKLAIGRRVKEAIRQKGLEKQQIGRAMRYLHNDLDFIRGIEPDDLLDVMEDLTDIDYEPDEARSVLYRMALSPRFPTLSQLSGHNLTQMGTLLRGFGLEALYSLRKGSIEEALDKIKDIDFDEHQDLQILTRLDLIDDGQFEDLEVEDIRRLGRLFRGMPTANIMKMKENVIEDALDDLDDADLGDVQKRIIAEKIRHDNRIPAKLMQLKSFADIVSLDDLDDFDDDEIKRYMNISSAIKWRMPQAAVLARKYKVANGVRRLRPSDLAMMGQVALGLLPDDLDDMVKTADDVLDLAEELKDMQKDLLSSQIDELVDSFNDVSDLDNQEVVIDQPEAMQGAYILAYLKPERFDKLEFTRAGKMAFVSQVAKMSSQKMDRKQVQFLARRMLDMIEDMDSSESQDETPEDRESRRLRSLGHMALGLTPSQISGFKGQAIIDNLDILRTLPLAKAQAKAVLEKVEDAAENWRCRGDVLARVGPLLQHHDNPFSDDCGFSYQEELLSSFSAVMKGMEKRREMVKERLEEGFLRENDDVTDDAGEKRLVDALVLVATQKTNVRKRRATISSDGSLTCDVLTRLGSSANQVDLQLLTSMPTAEFKDCLPKLGSVSDWSHEALTALVDKTKAVYSDVSSWTYGVTLAAGSIVAGLSPGEIQQLPALTLDTMHSIGRHRRLSPEQLKAGFRRWMNLSGKSDVSKISGGEFSSLAEFVCGLETAEINNINATTFKRALDVIGRSTSCGPEQKHAYVVKAVSIYGPSIGQWEPSLVAEMGHLLGALGADHIKMLTQRQLSVVSPMVIQHLPMEGLTAMTPVQLMALSSNQANAVTQAQYDALSADQQKSLEAKATVEFITQDDTSSGGTDGGKGGENGAEGVACSAVLTLTAAFIMSMLL